MAIWEFVHVRATLATLCVLKVFVVIIPEKKVNFW